MLLARLFYQVTTMLAAEKLEKSYVCRWDTEETLHARLRMVEEQIVHRGIQDMRVLQAMRQIPRHRFLPENQRLFAYSDMPVAIGFKQTISQPYMVAVMTEALALRGGEKVLEIGTGSGYQAAILSCLASEVYSVERIAELAERARKSLTQLEILNVKVIHGDGTLGLPEEAPFDAIIVTAAAPDSPQLLIKQLAEGGRLILPLGPRWQQRLIRAVKFGEAIHQEELVLCAFVPLIGKRGWKDSDEFIGKESEHADTQ